MQPLIQPAPLAPRSAPTVISGAAIIALMVAMIAGCGAKTEEASKPGPASQASSVDQPAKVEPPRPVRTLVVQAQPSVNAISLPAEIRPRSESRIGFRVGGKIATRLVSVGDRVAVGQVIARLDNTDLLPAVTAAKANLDAAEVDARLAQTELNRLRDLREKNFISQSALDRQIALSDAARLRAQAALASVKQAQNGLDFQVLRADVAGVVTLVEAEAGQVVGAGQTVVRIAKSNEVEALINIPEPDLAIARQAAQWVVVLPALGNRELKASIREISPIADPASRTFATRLVLSGDLRDVNLGMTAIAASAAAAGTQLLVPISALHSTTGQPKVWVLDRTNSTVREATVATAGFAGEMVRISSGLKPGDEVVSAGANLLRAGQQVKLMAAKP
jgi:membrane fusion protein, multidrug efflux system